MSIPSRFPTATVRIAIARLRDAIPAFSTQTSPVILRSLIRQLLQVGGPDDLLCDIRNLRTTSMCFGNDWRVR
jgi:hypothetical protein